MRIRFWGVRSGRPLPLSPHQYRQRLQQTLESFARSPEGTDDIPGFLDQLPANLSTVLGGNTACLSCETGDGTTIIFDAGSGLVQLGQELMLAECGSGQGKIHIFLSHTHVDRLEGLAHFAPLHQAGNQIHFYMPDDRLELRLIKYHAAPYYAVQLDDCAADLHYHPMGENESIQIGHSSISSKPLQHPGGSFAYRLQSPAGPVVYASGGQLPVNPTQGFNAEDPFFHRARVLILDAGRPPAGSTEKAPAWGLTECREAIQCGHVWQAEYLLLTNHPAGMEDTSIWQNFNTALQEHTGLEQTNTRTHLAREGLCLKIGSA